MAIVVLGTTFIDIKGYPDSVFSTTGRNPGHIVEVHGGVGRNVAEDLAKIGLPPVFLSLVDPTGTGHDAVDRLAKLGVDTSHIRAVKDGMGTWMAIFDNTNDVYASIAKRPELSPLVNVLEEGEDLIRNCDAVVIEMDIDERVVEKAIRLAGSAHKPIYGVISNMVIAMKRKDFFPSLDVFVCNLHEAGIYFEKNFSSFAPEEMLLYLKEHLSPKDPERFVITMGGRGSVYASKQGEEGILPAANVSVVDTTGAGDSFFSGIVAGLSKGKSLKDSCIIGTKLAASVIISESSTCPPFSPKELGL